MHDNPEALDHHAEIKAAVDQAPPFSPRQREHLRRIFTIARQSKEIAA